MKSLFVCQICGGVYAYQHLKRDRHKLVDLYEHLRTTSAVTVLYLRIASRFNSVAMTEAVSPATFSEFSAQDNALAVREAQEWIEVSKFVA